MIHTSQIHLLAALLAFVLVACSGQDRAPPEIPGVDLDRLTTEELNLYRRVLTEELSPCGGRVTLDSELRTKRCVLAPLAAKFVVYRVEENDTREEIAEHYLNRFGFSSRQNISIDGAPILGEESAKVTLVVFTDFLCPHCSRAAVKLREIVEENQGRVRLAYRSFPVSRQKGSIYSALAGLAAHRQSKFWQLHDMMFENRTRLNEDVIMALAEEAGIEMDQFREDILDPALEAQLRAEREQGEKLGVRGTPSLFINGRFHNEPLRRLEIAIEEELVRVGMNQTPSPTSESQTPNKAQTPRDGGHDGS